MPSNDLIPLKQNLKAKKPNLLTRMIVTLFLLIGLLVSAATISYFASLARPSAAYTFEHCAKEIGSTIEKTYPQVCTTKEGIRFVEKLSEDEQRLLDLPKETKIPPQRNEEICGGVMGKICPEGFTCQYEGSYPDASGKCIKN